MQKSANSQAIVFALLWADRAFPTLLGPENLAVLALTSKQNRYFKHRQDEAIDHASQSELRVIAAGTLEADLKTLRVYVSVEESVANAAMALSACGSRLEHLVIEGCTNDGPLSDGAVLALTQAMIQGGLPRSIVKLDMSRLTLHPKGAEFMLDRFFGVGCPNLLELHMRGICSEDDEGPCEIALDKYFRRGAFDNLVLLDISENDLSEKCMGEIIVSLCDGGCRKLRTLYLNSNYMGHAGSLALADALKEGAWRTWISFRRS